MAARSSHSVLLYDSDCSFCRTWVAFWQELTGDRVEYLPYQTAAKRYPDISEDDCRRSVQWIQGDERAQGADAVSRLFETAPGYGWFRWCYRNFPGFAAIAESLYRLIAGHRSAAAKVTRFFWGREVRPAKFSVASEIFSRVLAVIYIIAFASFAVQARGLIGEDGMLPVTRFLGDVYNQLGASSYWRLPTIFWWGNGDVALLSIAWGGALLALVSLMTRAFSKWQGMIFVVLWLYYLSIVNAGQAFMSFQWDWLLVEAGFLAIFLKPVRSRVWLYRLLIFRLILESGAGKLLSHDPTWRDLTALSYHYETQPLPTLLAWYANLSPLWFQKASTFLVLAVELGTPWLMLFPRRIRHIAGFANIGFQLLIILTGNYTFFNWLTIALCLFLFDDAFFEGLGERWSFGRFNAAPELRPAGPTITTLLWMTIVFLSGVEMLTAFGAAPRSLLENTQGVAQFGMVNHYGLFTVMTTKRYEIQVEGSLDGEHWEPYVFPAKPGPLNRRPTWVEPYQPRLDWQMWFAPFNGVNDNPWFIRMVLGLLRGSEPVKGLFAQLPLGGATPKLVRATIWQYHFTTWDEHSKTGNYWKRELKGVYFPAVGLKGAP